jgi:HlyD family secretion protein
LVFTSLLLCACQSATRGRASPGAQSTPRAPSTQATKSEAGAPDKPEKPAANGKKLVGVLVPLESSAVAIWPEAFSGELVVLEALAHGSPVEEGAVIAELDPRAIDDQLREAGLEARSAQVRHEGLLQRHAIDEAAAQAALAQSRAALDRARRALEGWKANELAFAERNDELAAKREAANVEDQKDELAQLEAMYKADDLTDATEEIVLKRSRRSLATTELGSALSRDRRRYEKDFPRKLESESREEAVRVQELALDRTLQGQAIDRRAREDAAARSAAMLEQQSKKLDKLQRDRALFSVRAPRAGVLLHGAAKTLRAGPPVRHARGTTLPARAEAFVVADPERLALAFDLPESKLASAHAGARATVTPLAQPEARLAGTLRLEGWPGPRAVGEENGYEAAVDLEGAPAGLVIGMKARVELAEAAAGEG